jgi:hypothetical protein
MNFGTVSLAAPQAASSRVSRYSRTDRRVLATASQSTSSDPAEERCLLASAAIRLASTAKAVPSTNPSAMQRRTTVSNSLRSRSQSRKRPCLFLEKVEWSGTSPSRPSRQNPVRSECRSSSQPATSGRAVRDQSKAGRSSYKMALDGPEPLTNRQSDQSTSASGRPEHVAQERTRKTVPPDRPAEEPSSIQISTY